LKNYDTKAALPILISAAKDYEAKLNNKHFMIVYQSNIDLETVEIGFRDMNFLHLTGVRSKLSAGVFYSACLSGKLSINAFSVDTKGKAQQKLMVLPYLADLLYNNCMIGDFINSGICIKADYFVGNTKAILSVGFRHGKTVDFPVTLYNESVKTLVRPSHKVVAIFSKEYNEPKYGKCTYLSKDTLIEDFPEEIISKIYNKDIK
jgi:hypothetical protein